MDWKGIGIIAAVAIAISIAAYSLYSSLFNDGVCRQCHIGQLEIADIFVSYSKNGSTRYYVYECDNCGWVLETPYNMRMFG